MFRSLKLLPCRVHLRGRQLRVPQDTSSRRSAGIQLFQAGVTGDLAELSFADSFVLGVLRGFRLIQSAGLTAEERRDFLSATHGSLDFDEVGRALQTLWDDQFTGHRPAPSLQANWHEMALAEELGREDGVR